MRTPNEKIEIQQEYVTKYDDLVKKIEKTMPIHKEQQLDEAINGYIEIAFPVLTMFIDEINDAITPLTGSAVVVAVAALEKVIADIKKLYNINSLMVMALTSTIKTETTREELTLDEVKQRMKGTINND